MNGRAVTVQRFYESLCSRDWDAMRVVFSEDAELGVSGRNPFAGSYTSRDAIVAVFRDIVDRAAGTFTAVRADTWDICTSDHHVVGFDWFGAQREGRELQVYLYFVCAVEGEEIKRMFMHAVEQYEFDGFWG